MDVNAGKSGGISNALNENKDIEDEEIGNDEMVIEEIDNAEINNKENDSRIWLAVNNAAVCNVEKSILDNMLDRLDDIDFDEIDVELQKENEFLESVERNHLLDDNSRFATFIREVCQSWRDSMLRLGGSIDGIIIENVEVAQ
ncbi:hypothetical protein HHI36_008806 [Cryptolaemus montrouzieri]|uniref:Uncharacterized protein n=1 Tax=Cryptolaemus montrouzieri TaxID=559131 RepID=A0ABD2MTF2_9CUCU